MLMGFSAVLPWARFVGPSLSLGRATTQVGYDYTPGVNAPDGDATRPLIIGFAIALGVLALALIATRVRGLGVLWRLLALLVLALPAWGVWEFWAIAIAQPDRFLADDPTTAGQIFGAGFRLAELIGAVHVDAGAGLWAISAACVLGLLALVIPAGKSVVGPVNGVVGPPYGAGYAPGYPPQAYPPHYPPTAPGQNYPPRI